MNHFEAMLALARARPGSDERIERFARSRGQYYLGPPESARLRPVQQSAIDGYFIEWARAFLSLSFDTLNDEDLSIRHAMQERMLIETAEALELQRKCIRRSLDAIEDEIKRRERKAGTCG